MENFNGIIIAQNNYKDNNLIVNLLTEQNIISFEALSIFKKNKQFINDIQLLNFGEFELYKGKTKYFKLKNCNIKCSLYKESFENKEMLFPYEFIKEIVLKTPPVDDFYKFFRLLSLTEEKIIQKQGDYLPELILFVSVYLKLLGFSITNEIERIANMMTFQYIGNAEKDVFNKNYKEFCQILDYLFNKRYIICYELISKIETKKLLIVFKNITKFFEQANAVKINSLNLY